MHQRAHAAFLVPRGLGALWIFSPIKTQVGRFLRIYYNKVNLSQAPADPAKLPRNQQPITPPESTQLSRSPSRRRRAWPHTQESLATRRLLAWLKKNENTQRLQLPVSRPPTPPPEQPPAAQEFIDLSEDICRRFNHLPELQASVFGEVPNHWNISIRRLPFVQYPAHVIFIVQPDSGTIGAYILGSFLPIWMSLSHCNLNFPNNADSSLS